MLSAFAWPRKTRVEANRTRQANQPGPSARISEKRRAEEREECKKRHPSNSAHASGLTDGRTDLLRYAALKLLVCRAAGHLTCDRTPAESSRHLLPSPSPSHSPVSVARQNARPTSEDIPNRSSSAPPQARVFVSGITRPWFVYYCPPRYLIIVNHPHTPYSVPSGVHTARHGKVHAPSAVST